MAWDTARTQQLLLDAAVEEFAEHGPAGARVARIAKRAGVNQERIYQYFGNKEKLFDAVLASELGKLALAVPLAGAPTLDLGDYAGRVFEYHRAHPHFARLLAWEGLQCQDSVVAEGERAAHYDAKIAAIADAQRAGVVTDEIEAGRIMHAVVALTAAWIVFPQLTRMLIPGSLERSPAEEREAVAGVIRRLAGA